MKDWLVKIAYIDANGKKTNDAVIVRNAEFMEIGEVIVGQNPFKAYRLSLY